LPAETSLLPTEPVTHAQGRHWRECMFCQDYSLSHLELQKFFALRDEANVMFEQQPRWDLFRSIYAEYFQQQPQLAGKEWMRLGFQGQHPETDLRGGGVMALQLILRFVKHRQEVVRQMEADRAGFFFAITAINVAFLMKKYFHLAEFLVAGKDEEVYCNRRAMKNFCRLLVDREEAYMDLHEVFLSHFYTKIWLPAEAQNTAILLQFNALFDRLGEQIRAAFEEEELFDFADFESRWE
jgi:hypothetical protein